MNSQISIIVPTLNEEACLAENIRQIQTHCPDCEILICDGGSKDGTLQIAESLGLRVVHSEAGRGRQLAAGAAEARGSIFWFIHADTVPAAIALPELRAVLTDEQIIGGNCTIAFDGESNGARMLTWIYPRLRVLGLAYGDSAIFVRRSAYERIGGFRPYPIFEDLDFIRRLKKAGPCIRLRAEVLTSSRRFEGRNFGWVFAWWIVLQILFWLGVPPARLGKMYSHVRSSLMPKRDQLELCGDEPHVP